MGIGIIDGAIDSIQATRKVLILARSIPDIIAVPDNALKMIVNASIAGAFLLLVNRLFLYPPTSGDPTKYFSTVGINILVSMTSLLPTFVVSVIAALTRRDDVAETVADRWLLVITYVWIMTLIVHFSWQIFISIMGTADYLRNFSNLIPGRASLGTLSIDIGAIIYSIIFSMLSYAILIYHTFYVSGVKSSAARQRKFIKSHLSTFIIAGLPCAFMLCLTLYSAPK